MTSETAEDPVLFEMSGCVAVLTLNRPAVLNAIDMGLAKRLAELLDRIEEEGVARAVLLRASGRAFCAGGDLSAFRKGITYTQAAAGVMEHFHPAVLKLASCRLPTVAAVHGTVAGAGVGLMLACDLAVASAETGVTLAYPKIGGTIDGGTSWFLPRVVGLRKAKELAFLADLIDARTAREAGLFNQLFAMESFGQDAFSYARRLAEGPTQALVSIKRLLEAAAESSLSSHLDAERDAFVKAAASNDFRDGLEAFFARETPHFQGQ